MKPTVSNPVFFRRDAVAAHGSATAMWVRGGQPAAATAHFTPRQLEVLALLCEGLPNKLICRRLNIASGTVKVHISGIFRELGVASRLQAVVAARSLGLGAMSASETPENPAASRSVDGAGARSRTAAGPIGLGI